MQCHFKQSAAKGVGGSAVVKGVILIPLGIGGINGVLETTVVEADVPLLLPGRLLKILDAVISIPKRVLRLEGHGVDVCMRKTSQRSHGHLNHGVDFHLPPGDSEAILLQRPKQISSPTASACLSSDREGSNGAHRRAFAQLGLDACGRSPKSGSGSWSEEGPQLGPCNSKLEGGVGPS